MPRENLPAANSAGQCFLCKGHLTNEHHHTQKTKSFVMEVPFGNNFHGKCFASSGPESHLSSLGQSKKQQLKSLILQPLCQTT